MRYLVLACLLAVSGVFAQDAPPPAVLQMNGVGRLELWQLNDTWGKLAVKHPDGRIEFTGKTKDEKLASATRALDILMVELSNRKLCIGE